MAAILKPRSPSSKDEVEASVEFWIDYSLRPEHNTMNSKQKVLLVGISGVSSSGKTTLSRLLRDIFPSTQILHEDDFYKTDAEIPLTSEGLADWDCLESINLPALESALKHIKSHGTLPPDLESKEDKNSVGESGTDQDVVKELTNKARENYNSATLPMIIVDGFLLFSQDMERIRELFDIRLLLRTDFKTAKQRREARTGYVTLEGFWEDPPGYVDNVVWPNYVKDHAFLFKDGDVEGEINTELCQQLNIRPMAREAQYSMTACLRWAYGILEQERLKR